MLDPRRLRLLVALRDRGTVSAVAGALHFTPSAVSQQLAVLEREAGTPLVRRVGRRMLLTEAGERLAARGVTVLDALDEAERAIGGSEAAGSVTVAAFQTAARHLVAPAFSALRHSHPQLDARLIEAEAEPALPLLLRGEVDVVVADEYPHALRSRDARLERHALLRDELLVTVPASHRLARGRRPVRLAELAGEAWVTAGEGTAYGQMLLNASRDAGFEPRIAHRVSDLQLLLELAARGMAVALVPSLGDPASDPRVAVRRVAGGLQREVFAATRGADRDRASVGAVLAALFHEVATPSAKR